MRYRMLIFILAHSLLLVAIEAQTISSEQSLSYAKKAICFVAAVDPIRILDASLVDFLWGTHKKVSSYDDISKLLVQKPISDKAKFLAEDIQLYVKSILQMIIFRGWTYDEFITDSGIYNYLKLYIASEYPLKLKNNFPEIPAGYSIQFRSFWESNKAELAMLSDSSLSAESFYFFITKRYNELIGNEFALSSDQEMAFTQLINTDRKFIDSLVKIYSKVFEYLAQDGSIDDFESCIIACFPKCNIIQNQRPIDFSNTK